MVENAQFDTLFGVLKRFQEAGILKELMLIGSWCLHFYRIHFEAPSPLAPIRTLDVDFLIPPRPPIKKETDIPELLKRQGFLPVFNRASGKEKERTLFLLKELPAKWAEKVLAVSRVHFPELNQAAPG